MIRITTFVVATITLLAACSTFDQADLNDQTIESHASGLVVSAFPSDQDPGGPFYARINPMPPHVFHDGEYAAIVFYRGPVGIPADFNLLQFFDLPGPGGPGAFAVQLNTAGTNLWHGAVGNGAPKMSTSHGLGAVPIWFVPAAAVLAKIAEGQGLTIVDLAEIDGRLVGYAAQFQEVLHPHPNPPEFGGGGHPAPKINLTARGMLEGGGTFQLNINGNDSKSNTRIRFN
jgi:hypothetical protein